MAFVYNMMVPCEGNFCCNALIYLTEGVFLIGSAFQILRHPGITAASFKALIPELAAVDPTILSRIDIDGQPGFFFSNVFD